MVVLCGLFARAHYDEITVLFLLVGALGESRLIPGERWYLRGLGVAGLIMAVLLLVGCASSDDDVSESPLNDVVEQDDADTGVLDQSGDGVDLEAAPDPGDVASCSGSPLPEPGSVGTFDARVERLVECVVVHPDGAVSTVRDADASNTDEERPWWHRVLNPRD